MENGTNSADSLFSGAGDVLLLSIVSKPGCGDELGGVGCGVVDIACDTLDAELTGLCVATLATLLTGTAAHDLRS